MIKKHNGATKYGFTEEQNAGKPFPRSYWVILGKVCAGAYPGDPDMEVMEDKLKGLVRCGIRHVINLMEPTELDHDGKPFIDYMEMLGELGFRVGAEMSSSNFPIHGPLSSREPC